MSILKNTVFKIDCYHMGTQSINVAKKIELVNNKQK